MPGLRRKFGYLLVLGVIVPACFLLHGGFKPTAGCASGPRPQFLPGSAEAEAEGADPADPVEWRTCSSAR
ncbi:hypothetical protein AQJ64_17150 [Streptomyces griseoruber]|uniref:Uncharacterized protein n=1 Tax=Streptomyces griseoruber TaxID=1943 RepID=A0A101T0H4_9ACTN|nr:hypothetical protein AQJ64_17150 [Streptomyces griseoruber]